MNRSLQRMIHVGCRQLGLDVQARRDLQVVVCGKTSMADMTEAELTTMLDRLKADGFQPTTKSANRRAAATRGDLRLIHVLWRKLGDAGALERPDRAGLNTFIRANFERSWGSVPADVDMMRDHEKIAAVIKALSDWGKRVSIDFDWGAHKK
ncbi:MULTISPECIES: regulatory protein GemA [unclassified Yoonia]|uniref:gp16 family protein n=1 Tax=unclassified Yoonia TaxID=2629118 RepID=UPI002AFEAFEE|nr:MULTISPECIES: regulatory protein GemA [unclassified Yoonia]